MVGIAPERRLPLRAGFGVAFFRNGVPVGYGDAFGLFDRLDVSLNIFPTFRDGESAFVYARLLRLYAQLFGSTCFSVDPYQIGLGNEEAIESGAFWFYRKLGFRSSDPSLEKLARREEERAASTSGYRTSNRTLERLSGANLLLDGETGGAAWDRFHVRNLGLAAARRMAASGLDADAFRRRAQRSVCAALGIAQERERPATRRAIAGLAPWLDLVADLPAWQEQDKALLRRAIREKAFGDEARFLASLRRLPLLRAALLRAGSVG